jgi:hypothetical protein
MILAALAAGIILGPLPAPGAVVSELPTPNLYRQPSYCRAVVEREVARQQAAFRGRQPAAQYALLRSLDGCDVPTPVGYHPSYLAPATANPPVGPEASAVDKH